MTQAGATPQIHPSSCRLGHGRDVTYAHGHELLTLSVARVRERLQVRRETGREMWQAETAVKWGTGSEGRPG